MKPWLVIHTLTSSINFGKNIMPGFPSIPVLTPVALLMVLSVMIGLSGCSTSAGALGSGNQRTLSGDAASKISQCKSTDIVVDSSSQCLLDDAACYPLSNGQWCTGERGNICPAGSVALPSGQTCPPGKRCFRVGESLECTII